MSATINLKIRPGTSDGENYLSAADVTAAKLYARGQLLSLTEAKFADTDSSSYITRTTSMFMVPGGSTLQTMAPIATARAPVKYATPDGQYGVRAGFDSAGVASATHATLIGSNMVLPTGDWHVSMLAAWAPPASGVGFLWSVTDHTAPFGFGAVSSGAMRAYQDIIGNTFSLSATGLIDGVLRLWTFERASGVLTVRRDGTSIVSSGTAFAAPADRTFRTWSRYNSSNADSLGGQDIGKGTWEWSAIGLPSAEIRAWAKAKALEYDPTLVIA